MRNGYNKTIVSAYFTSNGLPEPVFEYRFAAHIGRKWRFDICFPSHKVYVEVDGGIFVYGRHNRGAALLKQWEKDNTAASMGWRGLRFQPKELCLEGTIKLIESTINYVPNNSAMEGHSQNCQRQNAP